MASIHKDFVVDADPEAAWDAVRDFAAVHDRLARDFVTATEDLGRDRVVTFSNGNRARERLVSIDEQRRRLVYAVVDSRLGLSHHQASVEILGDPRGRTRFLWTSDVLPDEVAPVLDAHMDEGAEAIRRTLADRR